MSTADPNSFEAAVERYCADDVAVLAYIAAASERRSERSRLWSLGLHTSLHLASVHDSGALRLHHGATETLDLHIGDANLAGLLADAINRILARHAAPEIHALIAAE